MSQNESVLGLTRLVSERGEPYHSLVVTFLYRGQGSPEVIRNVRDHAWAYIGFGIGVRISSKLIQ